MAGGAKEFYGSQSGAGGKQGFFGKEPIERPTVTGEVTASNTALVNLLSALEDLGLIVDSTTTTADPT